MNPTSPFDVVNLHGDGTMRGVTLALPTARVRDFLPAGLELGEQTVTPPGTHPVILFYHDMIRATMSIPSLLPSMTYHEHSVGVPFAYMARGASGNRSLGPYYFMPRLYLDNFLAVIGGLWFWGFAKQPASFVVTENSYSISSPDGRRLTSLSWESTSEHRPIREFPNFEPVRQMLMQPMISMLPAALGPFFFLSNFDKDWERATVRPLRTALEVDVEYVPSFTGGRYPNEGRSSGIDESVLGSYELRAPWRLGLLYPPGLRR
jgi:hypothetical protein